MSRNFLSRRSCPYRNGRSVSGANAASEAAFLGQNAASSRLKRSCIFIEAALQEMFPQKLCRFYVVTRRILMPLKDRNSAIFGRNDTFSAFQTKLYHYRTKTQFPKFLPIIQLANCSPISALRAKLSERKLCLIPWRTFTAT